MIRTFFGSPGCGKTTQACKFAKKNRKKYKRTFCNFDNKVPWCGSADLTELGKWTFPVRSYIAIDEAGIEFNSRAYKALPKCTIAWFKKHRHYKCAIDVFSQSWEDMDVTLRRLTDQLWYMYRLGPFTLCRRVYKRVTVNKETEQIIDGYRMASALWLLFWPLQWPAIPFFGRMFAPKWTLTFRPFYYRYFDSWEMDDIPVKDFPVRRPRRNIRERLTFANVVLAYLCSSAKTTLLNAYHYCAAGIGNLAGKLRQFFAWLLRAPADER